MREFKLQPKVESIIAKYKIEFLQAWSLLMVFSTLMGVSGGCDPRSKLPWLFSYSIVLLLATVCISKYQEKYKIWKLSLIALIVLPVVLALISLFGFEIGLLFTKFARIQPSVEVYLCQNVFTVLLLAQSIILLFGKLWGNNTLILFAFVVSLMVALLQFVTEFMDFKIGGSFYFTVVTLIVTIVVLICCLIKQTIENNESNIDKNSF